MTKPLTINWVAWATHMRTCCVEARSQHLGDRRRSTEDEHSKERRLSLGQHCCRSISSDHVWIVPATRVFAPQIDDMAECPSGRPDDLGHSTAWLFSDERETAVTDPEKWPTMIGAVAVLRVKLIRSNLFSMRFVKISTGRFSSDHYLVSDRSRSRLWVTSHRANSSTIASGRSLALISGSNSGNDANGLQSQSSSPASRKFLAVDAMTNTSYNPRDMDECSPFSMIFRRSSGTFATNVCQIVWPGQPQSWKGEQKSMVMFSSLNPIATDHCKLDDLESGVWRIETTSRNLEHTIINLPGRISTQPLPISPPPEPKRVTTIMRETTDRTSDVEVRWNFRSSFPSEKPYVFQ
jgi:hypothetical protein